VTAPDPVTAVRSLDTDWLLDLMASMANAGGFSVAVTLWTPTGVVSGELIGSPEWIGLLREQIRTTGDEQAQRFAADLESVEQHIVQSTAAAQDSPEPLSFLHLKDAVTVMPDGEPLRHGLWRGRFVDVAGWTLGRL